MPAESTTPILNDSQRRIVGAALTTLAFLGTIALLIAAFYVLGRLIGFFSSVIWPLAVAGVLALILRPLVEALERRFKIRRLTSVVVLYGIFVLLVAGTLPFWHALRMRPGAQAAMRGVNAAVVGLLGTALYNPVWTSAVLDTKDFAVAVAGFVLPSLKWTCPI